MSATAPVTISIPTDLITRIDQAAQASGMSRSQYVVSWLPETYDPTPAATTENGHSEPRRSTRKARAV